MVICPDCGKDVKEAKFCSNCGAMLPKIDEAVGENMEEITPDVEFESDNVVAETTNEVVSETVVDDVPYEVIEENNVGANDNEPTQANIVKKSVFCTNCGTEIKQETPFCPQCGFKLIQEQTPQTKFCQSCGKKININAEICPHCGVRVAGVAVSEEKSVLLAAILSFLFPGLGHLYNGLNKKGVSFIVAYIVSAILIFILIGFVLVLIVWIWALVDVIKTTEAINRGEYVEDKLF